MAEPNPNALAWELVAAYEDAQRYLLHLIATMVDDEDKAFYTSQYEQILRLHRLAQAYLSPMESRVNQLVHKIAVREYEQSVREAMTMADTPVPQVIDAGSAHALATAAVGEVTSQHQMILRQAEDIYRTVVHQGMRRAMLAGVPNQIAVQDVLNKFADSGITSFVDKAGRRWSMDTYTDMAVRTVRNHARNEGHMRGYDLAGVRFVKASWHPASAPQCAPYQNQILSIDGGTGAVEVTNIVTGEPMTITVKATLRQAIAAGYHHPNCRHRDIPYTPGTRQWQPTEGWEESNPAQYAALQRQREIERHLRRWKRRDEVALTPQAQAQASARIKHWEAELKKLIRENKHLSRQEWRETTRVGA